MRIDKLSENLTPLHKGILFGIDTENDTPTHLTVEIINVATGEIVATQMLHNTTSTTVNIAPYINDMEVVTPSKTRRIGFSTAPTATYKIRINDIESEEVVVSVNNCNVAKWPSIITSMPTTRRITKGKNDEVWIATKRGQTIYAEIESDIGETLQVEYTPQTEISIMTISTEDFQYEVHSFDMLLYCNGEIFESLHYKVDQPLKTATCLAWLSDKGTIERYTFPKSLKTTISSEKKSIMMAQGVCSASCRTRHIITLSSRIEPQAIIEGLAQIAASPKVWIERNGEWELIEIITSEIDYNLFGEPSHLHIEACSWQKEVSLW